MDKLPKTGVKIKHDLTLRRKMQNEFNYGYIFSLNDMKAERRRERRERFNSVGNNDM